MLEELLDKFLENKAKLDAISEEQDALKEQIKNALALLPEKKYLENGYKASLTKKVTFAYKDTTAILAYLDKKKMSEMYVTRKIDTTKFNNELKTKGMLYNDVKGFVEENESESLTVSKK